MIVIGVFVLTVGVAAAVAFTKPKKYEANATIHNVPEHGVGPRVP